MEFQITKILQEGISEDKEVIWLKCLTSSKKVIAFWGEFDNPNRNIVALRNQNLPVIVEIISPEECEPTQSEIKNYDLSYSVPYYVQIQINPEF